MGLSMWGGPLQVVHLTWTGKWGPSVPPAPGQPGGEGGSGEIGESAAVRDLPQPQEAERDRARRELLLQELEQALLELDQTAVHQRRAYALRISRRFGKDVRQLPDGRLVINREVGVRDERLDGKYLIHTSDQQLSTEEVALGYRQLLQVERGWRDLKQELELRPMFHRKEDRIRAHVLLCFLGLLMMRVAENRTQQTWPRIRRELQRLVLVDLSGPAGQVSQTSKPTPSQTQLFEALQVPAPIRVRAASSSRQPEAA
ncbi:MAG: transposase [Candidatus Dormibacteraeota bacterium]|nr:transposase [Candidatus Dormibacteraeota bacterium]